MSNDSETLSLAAKRLHDHCLQCRACLANPPVMCSEARSELRHIIDLVNELSLADWKASCVLEIREAGKK